MHTGIITNLRLQTVAGLTTAEGGLARPGCSLPKSSQLLRILYSRRSYWLLTLIVKLYKSGLGDADTFTTVVQ